MCYALSHLYNKLYADALDDLLAPIIVWNETALITEQEKHAFDNTIDAFKLHHLHYNRNGLFYIGDAFDDLHNQAPKAHVVSNHKHSIAIQPLTNSTMSRFYDPNEFEQVIKHHDLSRVARVCIGPQIYISSDERITPRINSHKDFIQHGGLQALSRSFNFKNILIQLSQLDLSTLERSDFYGLFHCDAQGFPAWI